MKRPIFLFVLSPVLFFASCHSSAGDQRTPGNDTFLVDPSNPKLPPPKSNPEFRAQVKKDPVGEYREKTGHILGDFVVRLYQTSKTMYYRADVEYEGLPGTDTIKLPDLGTEPQPVLQKGETKYSCVIGFMDNDKKFRELKLVHVTPKGDQFKITTLKHWVVMDHYRLVSQ
ncbi:hypothetical protein [Puia dinghuensis]|uniref:Uncharacterized protein n=1 Tax=Puia dinghuensis TaxID=1792502 RepID=A0A8J2U7P4_9BACT|nr:hypothetical protein [Puia dinghuensis]GGA84725.1 hypothetical protein GCM10011511_04690 [Puia dinghuensis]